MDNNENRKSKKSILFAVALAIGLFIMVVFILAHSGSDNSNSNDIQSASSDEIYEESNFDSESSDDQLSADSFIKDVKKNVKDDVGKGESIKNVTLRKNDLCVHVDFKNADPKPITIEELAESRASSITDSILELSEYDYLWDTITVDFGSVGKITNRKENIKENEYGGRYFPLDGFILKK